MFFNVYGENAVYQFLGFVLVFIGLILSNEFTKRTKYGGIISFIIIPIILTIYFICIYICSAVGQNWAKKNGTYMHMNSWFHYTKFYAADIASVGFILIKNKWLIGKKDWFKVYPFIIISINILIDVISDFESAVKGYKNMKLKGTRWWLSSEGIWLYGGWWNVINGIAGILNIFCMTDWWGIYTSKDKNDMLWPDMTRMFILSYDAWNFEYTYNNLPTHSWYCGIALLLAPTFANHFWNKGGWIQNRANTLSFWCMFAQTFPNFLDDSVFSVVPSLYKEYKDKLVRKDVQPKEEEADPNGQGIFAVLSFTINCYVLSTIIKRWIEKKRNPYLKPIFEDSDDYKEAYKRVEINIEKNNLETTEPLDVNE